MYKLVMTHEILPGKLPDVISWLQGNYDKLREKDPDLKVPGDPEYKGPLRQYVTVYGSVNQYVMELDTESIPDQVYALATHNKDLLPFLVPGSTKNKVLKGRVQFFV